MAKYGEPWKISPHFEYESIIVLADRTGLPIAMTGDEKAQAFDRIVACVNACAGIPTEELVPLLERLRELEQRLDDEENRAWERSEQKE